MTSHLDFATIVLFAFRLDVVVRRVLRCGYRFVEFMCTRPHRRIDTITA